MKFHGVWEKKEVNWAEVLMRHGAMTAVKTTDGRVSSILCGNHEHADSVSESEIRYSVPKRPAYANALRALISCAEQGSDFAVFYKVQKNQWRDLGRFKIADMDTRKNDVMFRLVQVTQS